MASTKPVQQSVSIEDIIQEDEQMQEDEQEDEHVKESTPIIQKAIAAKSKSSAATLPKKQPKKKRISKQVRASVTFPVSRCKRFLKEKAHVGRVSDGAAVALASLGQYLIAELGDLCHGLLEASKKPGKESRKLIMPRHLQNAMMEDEEIRVLITGVRFFKPINSVGEIKAFIEKKRLDEALVRKRKKKSKTSKKKTEKSEKAD